MPAPPCQPNCSCGKHIRLQEHNKRIGVSVANSRKKRKNQTVLIIDLDDPNLDRTEDVVVTLEMLCKLRGVTHRRWRVTPSAGGAWDYQRFEG